ncbi:unnamed protein product [Adineta ricciae]|uniref:DUF7789 domain-containing protein n=1 Tax=Adineta ricciae TaxID=249248 RepID=A0A813Z3R7_ADIRI|nr:unnamed protein product [Adineta ricciae]CAF0900457.1 unnamed protein product [Adineta ricciae]
MDATERTSLIRGFRPSNDNEIEQSGLLGTRRGCVNINRYEIIFLIVGVLAAIATDTLTIIRLIYVTQHLGTTDSDFAYGILILVNSLFLLLFLITGILYQRISDITAFVISAVMLTIYVIAHYVARYKDGDSTDAKIRLMRLIFTSVFNVFFIPLAFLVIKDYQRDEFSKRLFGAFPEARRPLRTYNIFDCIARINTMFSISTLILNLYNFNDLKAVDLILLPVGIPVAFLWLALGIGMVRLESRKLVVVFCCISICQPAFLIYALYSAIVYSPPPPVTILTASTTSTTTTQSSSTSTANSTLWSTSTVSSTPWSTSPLPALVSVPSALYVCMGINFVTHILSFVFGCFCIRNFGKDLKQRVFNNRFDKWFQSKITS